MAHWLVDVAIGKEDDGTLAGDAVDVDRTVRTMDAIARSLEISAGDSPAH